jgi:hypothetical protein
MYSGFQGNMLPAISATIANGQTVSSVIALKGFSLVGIKVPAAFTGTALTISMCDTEGGTYVPVKSTASGTAFSQTVTTSSYYAIDPALTQGAAFIKLTSGSAEGGARTLVCSLKGI